MKANVTTRRRLRARSRKTPLAAAAVVVLALSACTSDPGPKRVAEDIIKSESLNRREAIDRGENVEPLNEECLLDALDDFSDDELTAINGDLDSGDETSRDAFATALEACI